MDLYPFPKRQNLTCMTVDDHAKTNSYNDCVKAENAKAMDTWKKKCGEKGPKPKLQQYKSMRIACFMFLMSCTGLHNGGTCIACKE